MTKPLETAVFFTVKIPHETITPKKLSEYYKTGADNMVIEQDQYILVFSSNYHGYYAEDILTRGEVQTKLRKAPRAVGKSCQFAIYINKKDLQKAIDIIDNSKVKAVGIYELIKDAKNDSYKKISY